MSEEVEKSGSVPLERPEEEALRLKTLAEERYNYGDLNSALNYANLAHELHPSINGLSEMLTSLKIILAATPVSQSSSTTEKSTLDYYRILQLERFSHINSIKKQYKKLALRLHPDKNPSVASGEAFKLVGDAARVLSDKDRRKEYDVRLRIAMQSEAADEVGLEIEDAEETFLTACSACRLLHQFERKYLGHNLMCPSCKKTFKAIEVEEDRSNGGNEGTMEKNEGVGEVQTRVSARIRERVAKGGHGGVVEKFGLGTKRKLRNVVDISERPGAKVTRMKKVRNVGKYAGDGNEDKLEKEHIDNDRGAANELRSTRSGRKVRDGFEKAPKRGGVEVAESEKSKKAEDSGEETMTLSQMRVLVKKKKKKKKLDESESGKETEVNGEKLEVKEKEVDIEEKEKEKEREEEVKDKGKDMMNLREMPIRRRVSNYRKLEDVNHLHPKTVKDTSLKEGNLEVLLVEKDVKGKEKEIEGKKQERRRTSKYGNSDFVKTNTSKNQVDTGIERFVPNEKGNLEILPVEDSDFYDFDKDRKEKCFKKGQVWALYDDDVGIPRHYGLIDRVVSLNPFQVIFIWLRFQSNKCEELISWPNTGCHVSCGIFQLSRKVTIKCLNVFSHLVDCERATKELYRIYPKKGSVWAMYNNNAPQTSEIDQGVENTRSYDIVVSLSSYSEMHGLSIGYLDKVPGFRTVFSRKELGAKAVICLGPKDVKLLSHQIPAKKLSGDERPGLPKDSWELDPASLTPKLLIAS